MQGDMKHFRELTMGSVMIMGRKTLDSIGVALPGRKTIVITRNDEEQIASVEVAHSLSQAYVMADENKSENSTVKRDVFVVGGGEIYQQALVEIERIYATEVDVEIANADTFFPELDNSWQITKVQHLPADNNNIYPYSFITYEKK